MFHLALMAVLLFQTPATPPKLRTSAAIPSLSQLMRDLPADIRSNHFDFGPFSDSVTAACEANPTTFASSVSYFEEDLNDPNEKVRFYTLAVLDGLAVQTGNSAPILALQKKIETILLSDTEDNRLIAINTASNLGEHLPESIVRDLEKMLEQKELTERLTLVSGRILMGVRPMDTAAQRTVIAVVTDPDRARDMRCQLLNAAANELTGPELTEYVIMTVNSSTDKYTRDCAIPAAERIGPRAVAPVSDTLRRIAADPDESPQSKILTNSALKRIQTPSHE